MNEINLFWKMFPKQHTIQFLLNSRKKIKNKKELYSSELKWVCYKSNKPLMQQNINTTPVKLNKEEKK